MLLPLTPARSNSSPDLAFSLVTSKSVSMLENIIDAAILVEEKRLASITAKNNGLLTRIEKELKLNPDIHCPANEHRKRQEMQLKNDPGHLLYIRISTFPIVERHLTTIRAERTTGTPKRYGTERSYTTSFENRFPLRCHEKKNDSPESLFFTAKETRSFREKTSQKIHDKHESRVSPSP